MGRDLPTGVLFSQVVTDVAQNVLPMLNTLPYTVIEVFIANLAFVGGASPTMSFKLAAVDGIGTLYTQVNLTAIAPGAGANSSAAFGTGSQNNKAMGRQFQLTYIPAGAPTSFSFFCEIIAR